MQGRWLSAGLVLVGNPGLVGGVLTAGAEIACRFRSGKESLGLSLVTAEVASLAFLKGVFLTKTGRLAGRVAITAACIVAIAIPVSGPAVAGQPIRHKVSSGEIGVQTANACQRYLWRQGYRLTPQRVNACATGQGGSATQYVACVIGLAKSGVRRKVAGAACTRAAQ